MFFVYLLPPVVPRLLTRLLLPIDFWTTILIFFSCPVLAFAASSLHTLVAPRRLIDYAL